MFILWGRVFKTVFWIRIGFNTEPDQAVYLHADPDQGSQTIADPDPGKTLVAIL
jgi:hypothetical protein